MNPVSPPVVSPSTKAFAAFVDNPQASFGIAAFFFCVLVGALMAQLFRKSGDCRWLVVPPLLWTLNGVWELLHIFKGYDVRFDFEYTYPLLALLSVLSIIVWMFVFVRQLLTASEDSDRARAVQESQERFLRVVFAVAEILFSIAPYSTFVTARVLVGAVIGGVALFFFVIGLAFKGFVSGLLLGVGVGVVLSALLLTYFVLHLWYEQMKRIDVLYDRVSKNLLKVERFAKEFDELVLRFESGMVGRYHSITKRANDAFNLSKKVSVALQSRLGAVERLCAKRGEPELLAAEEVLRADIEVPRDFLNAVVSAGTEGLVLTADQWGETIERLQRELREVLREMESATPRG